MRRKVPGDPDHHMAPQVGRQLLRLAHPRLIHLEHVEPSILAEQCAAQRSLDHGGAARRPEVGNDLRGFIGLSLSIERVEELRLRGLFSGRHRQWLPWNIQEPLQVDGDGAIENSTGNLRSRLPAYHLVYRVSIGK